MSGSDPSVNRRRGGGGGDEDGPGDGPGDPDGDDACPGWPFDTVLASPYPDTVAGLSEAELLDLVAVESPARGVMARTIAGEDVGALARDIRFIRGCMEQGYEYEAEVVRVAGGSVTVTVRARDDA